MCVCGVCGVVCVCERERERERDREIKDRRSSKEVNIRQIILKFKFLTKCAFIKLFQQTLDHRNDIAVEEKRSSLRRDREMVNSNGNPNVRNHSNSISNVNNNTKSPRTNSGCLRSIIFPLISEVSCFLLFV